MTKETRTSAPEGRRLSPNNTDAGVNNSNVKKSKYLPKNATIFVGFQLPNQMSTLLCMINSGMAEQPVICLSGSFRFYDRYNRRRRLSH
jgi:hypothetical protein